ncbi:antA/AntB antirepressor family protein [Clostridium butyricum]|uniref:antA/AntB antirepressor family protein n=1 Tax=Clostridium butyricum TaxID=1492 RepID=UPI002ABE4B96|nr:antA/AntB antirepressor family protein [Clostridium butyricum]
MENELIKIKTNENGEQLVSAKELYLGLGLNKAVWSRWYKSNIQENEFFKENIDWTGVQHDVEGNETMDFAISLEFAKHIAMMTRTTKSHEYRNYFIQCEKILKENTKLISSQQDIKELKNTLDDFKRLTEDAKKMYKPSHKMKLDYSKMIRALTNTDEEYDIVKQWVFANLGYTKWEDACIDDKKKIIDTKNTVARLLTIKKMEQLSMF